MKVSILSIVVVVTLVTTLSLADSENNCPFNQVYQECGSACPPTCANRHDTVICPAICVSGCFCPSGLYITEEGQCVQEEECPPNHTINCPFDRVYKECGSACSPTCADRELDDIVICPAICVPGCFCPSGMYATEDGGCVQKTECPPTCVNGLAHNTCGSACPITCDNMDEDRHCIHVCVDGCFCPQGMVINGDTCVQPEECTNSSSCIIKGIEYSDGDSFPSVDGCNECTCDDGEISCTEAACYSGVLRMCKVGDLEVFEKQPYNDSCTVCTCNGDTINCTVPQQRCANPVYMSYDLTMVFSVDYDSVVTDVDRFKDSVRSSLINKFGPTYNLLEAQISNIEVSRGSVVVVITLEDSKQYQQSANITILLTQMEQDYISGSLTITYNGTTLQPATITYSVNDNGDGDGDGDGGRSLLWILYVVVAMIVLLVLIIIVVIAVIYKKKRSRVHNILENNYQGTKKGGTLEKIKLIDQDDAII